MNLLRKPAFQLSKHLLILGLVACLSAPAWAASGTIRALSLDPVTHRLTVDASGPVRAVVNTLNIGGRKRIIVDIDDAAIGFDLPRDAELLQILASQWSAVRNVSVNQFDGHGRSIVRILLDVDGDVPTAQLLQAQGSRLELQIGTPPVVTQPARSAYSQPEPAPYQTQPPQRPVAPQRSAPAYPEQPARPQAAVTQPVAQQSAGTVSGDAYQRALQGLEDQKKMIQGLQQQMAELTKTQNEEIKRLRAENAALQNRLNLVSTQPAANPHMEAELNNLRQSVAQADARINALTRENQGLKAKVTAASAPNPELSAAQAEVDKLRKMNQSLQDQLALSMKASQSQSSSGIELEGLKQTLVNLNKKYDDLLRENRDLQSKLNAANLQPELDRLQAANQSLQDQLTRAYQERNALKEQVGAAQASGEKLNALQGQLEQAKSELAELRAENARLNAESRVPMTDTSALTAELNRYKEKSENLQAQLAQLQMENNRLKTQPPSQAQPSGSNPELAELKTQLDMAQESLNTSIQTINDQNKEIAYLRNQIADLQKNYANASGEQIAALQNELGQKNAQIKKLQSDLAAANPSQPAVPDDSALKKQLDNLTEKYKRSIDDFTRQQMEMEQELLAAKIRAKDTEALQKQLDEANKQLTALQTRQATASSQEVTALRSELASAKEEIQALRSNVTELQAENEKLAVLAKMPEDMVSKADLDKQRQENQELRAAMVKMDGQLKALQAGKSSEKDLHDQIAMLEQQLTDLNEKHQAAINDATRARKQAESLEADLKVARAVKPPQQASPLADSKELNELKARIASLEADLKKAKARSPKGEDQNAQLAADLQAQVDSLSLQLGDARKEVADLQAKLLASAGSGKPQTPTTTAATPPEASQAVSLAEADKHYQKAKGLMDGGDAKKAIEEYRQALRYDPSNSQYVYEYSIALAEDRQYDLAIDVLTKHLQRNPGDRLAYHQLGKIYLLNDQLDAANQALSRALPVSTLNNYGTSLKKLGRLEEAEGVYKLALRLAPNDTEVLFNLGTLYNAENKLNEAKATYQEALRIKPDFAEAHYNLGLIFSKLGDKQSAVTHLERFLQLAPGARNAETIRSYLQKLKA